MYVCIYILFIYYCFFIVAIIVIPNLSDFTSIESPELHNSTTPQSGRSPTVTGRGLPGPAVE